jgi:uncharacterized protein (TIGR02265 family)
MPLDRGELRIRQSLSKPSDVLRGSVFRTLVEHTKHHLPEKSPGLQKVCAHYGRGPLSDLFNYPVHDWLALLWDVTDALEPKLGGINPSLESIGAAVVTSFLSSPVGKVAVTLGSNRTPIDMLFNVPGVYAAGASYGKRKPERLGPRVGRVEMRGDFAPPPYHVGLLRQGLAVYGHKVDVKAKVYGLVDYDMEVTWLE